MADNGWISKWAFVNDALTADTLGRSAMEDGFIQTAKIEDGAITSAKLASASMLYTGVYGYSEYGRCVYG